MGGTLLDEGLAWAFSRGLSVYLDTTNPDARRLYERKGFIVVGDAKLRGDGPLACAMLATEQPAMGPVTKRLHVPTIIKNN